jgi:hypothetical protein
MTGPDYMDTAEPMEWLPADDPYPLLDAWESGTAPADDDYWTHETVEEMQVDAEPVEW